MSENTETAVETAATTVTKTFTQDEVNDIVSKRLTKEREKYADYEDLKSKVGGYEEKINSLTTEYEKSKSDYEAKIQSYELNSVKMKIALEMGLPAELADRLQGTDEASLREDADKLAAYAKPKTTAPQYEPEPVVNADPKKAALSQMLAQMKT